MGSGGFFWYCNLCQVGSGTRSCILITNEISIKGPNTVSCLLVPEWSAEWLPIKVYNCPKCKVMMIPHGAVDERGKCKMTCPECCYTEQLRVI